MPDASPWLTIVTIVKDDPIGLGRTLASLGAQDLTDVEYVVIDSSADRASVASAMKTASIPGAEVHWVEPAGIYPAMNAGIERAHGTFVYFANAGDELLPDALSRARTALEDPQCVWAYGAVDFVQSDGSIIHEPIWQYAEERAHLLARRRFPPHQGTFMRRAELQRQGGFDTRYRIAADYLAVLRADSVAPPIELGFTVARFAVGGASTVSWRTALSEFHRARVDTLQLGLWGGLHERMHTLDTWLRTAVHRLLTTR